MGVIVETFGELVFNQKKMKTRLNSDTYKSLMKTLKDGQPLDISVASDIARAMKEWALENGATHFTHWFQPQRVGTAEKHDAFINYDETGQVIEKFSASQLIQSEPDASSFPSGGIRSTFEARGYTAWDPTSPVFLREHSNGKSLIIPSIYLSWTGEALDMKTPLNRSTEALNLHAIALQKYLGNRQARRIKVFAGMEQEYFLIPMEVAKQRLDLQLCDRTVFGTAAIKGQHMEDHYFGSIQPRIMTFMNALDKELYRYGIPSKTKHNEVAPNQFELAPLYEEMNVAIDHNLLTMEIMRRVSQEHGFYVVFHEKPFAGVNGSGKHMNWSLGDNTGANYLEPSRSPLKNISFLMTLAAVFIGLKEHSGLIHSAIVDAGNEHRLGANEAPPAILSVYLGSYLTDLLDHIEGLKNVTEKELNTINHGLEMMPKIVKDTSDRNRTSPIAFTGNKFELRAVGASANGSAAAKALNMCCAYGYATLLERLKKEKGDVKKAAFLVLKNALKETRSVRFEGDNYTDEWKEEAKKRSLFQIKTPADAIAYDCSKDSIALHAQLNVLTQRELESRADIKYEAYINTKKMEINVAIKLIRKHVLPALLAQLTAVATAAQQSTAAGISSLALQKDCKQIEGLYSAIQTKETYLLKFLANLVAYKTCHEEATDLATTGQKLLQSLRDDVDLAETQCAASYWTLPGYDEMLLSV